MEVTSSGTSSKANTSVYSESVTVSADGGSLYPSTYNEEDYTQWQTFDFGTEYVFNVSSKTWEGTSPADAGVASVTVKARNLKVENTSDSPINIRLTGTNSTFKVTVDGNGQTVKITMDNLNLTSADRVLNIKNSAATYIVLEGSNSLETLINSYDKNVLKSETDMVFDGTGSLSVIANSKNGIVTEYGVIAILNGDITVTVASTTAERSTLSPMPPPGMTQAHLTA